MGEHVNLQTACMHGVPRARVHVHVSLHQSSSCARRHVHAHWHWHWTAALNEQLITRGLAGISEIKVD